MPPRRLRSRLLAWTLRSRAASGRLLRSRVRWDACCVLRQHPDAPGVLGRQSAIPWVVGQDRYAPRLKTGEMSPDNPSGVQMLPENASDVQMSPDNHPASTHCPATPSASEQSHLKRDRGTNVHASFGNFFFAHRQTPRHQRSKTPGLHEAIMRLPAPDQIDIPITGTNASQALGALEDCPPPDRHIGTY